MARANRVLSVRLPEETFGQIVEFQAGQLALPSQTEAIKALIRLGFEAWKKMRGPS